ncbi:MAG: glycosyltransferase [Methanothrix sp.]
MFSIVCVYNDETLLNSYLLKSLKDQMANYELILEDNTKSRFSSAAQALNHGGKKASSKYIMFIHQDVDLSSTRWLGDAERWLDAISDLGIAGVAGMSEHGKTNRERGRNIIKHGIPPQIWSWGNPISIPEVVQTLDECLIIIPKEIFDAQGFDEIACNGWDLYAVDYCLSVKRIGLQAYAIPMQIYHGSLGHLTENYFVVLSKVLRKHKKYFKRVNTTVGSWSTFISVTAQRKYMVVNKTAFRLLISFKRFVCRMVKNDT